MKANKNDLDGQQSDNRSNTERLGASIRKETHSKTNANLDKQPNWKEGKQQLKDMASELTLEREEENTKREALEPETDKLNARIPRKRIGTKTPETKTLIDSTLQEKISWMQNQDTEKESK